MQRNILVTIIALAFALAFSGVATAQTAAKKKPNIVIIWGDDIGYWNVSMNNQGMMGYKTPNIDRIAKEPALHPAGRCALLGGQSGQRRARLGRALRRDVPVSEVRHEPHRLLL